MESLIQAVKDHPCLWDVEHSSYKNWETRDAAWKNVANLTATDEKTVKRQWKRLRDSYRDALKRQNSLRGTDAENWKPWRYQELMEFLLPHMTTKKNINNSESGEGAETDSRLLDGSEINEDYSSSLQQAPDGLEDTFNVENTTPVSKKAKLDFADKLLEYLRKEQQIKLSRGTDPTDQFFSSMCESTKLLPKHLQLEVKRKIFQAVSEAEEILSTSFLTVVDNPEQQEIVQSVQSVIFNSCTSDNSVKQEFI